MSEAPETPELTPQESDCPCGSHYPFQDCCACKRDDEEVAEAIAFTLSRRGYSDAETNAVADAVVEALWSVSATDLHAVEMTTAAALGVGACRYCADTGHFYGDAELGPCGCPATADDLDLDSLIG